MSRQLTLSSLLSATAMVWLCLASRAGLLALAGV